MEEHENLHFLYAPGNFFFNFKIWEPLIQAVLCDFFFFASIWLTEAHTSLLSPMIVLSNINLVIKKTEK